MFLASKKYLLSLKYCMSHKIRWYLVVRYVEQVWDGVGGGQGLGVAVVLAGARVVEHASLALYLYTLS